MPRVVSLRGVAPIPASSGQRTRHRLARAATVSSTPLSTASPSHKPASTDQVATNTSAAERGDTTMEAIRVLKRKIARRIYATSRTQSLPRP
jgi:transposase